MEFFNVFVKPDTVVPSVINKLLQPQVPSNAMTVCLLVLNTAPQIMVFFNVSVKQATREQNVKLLLSLQLWLRYNAVTACLQEPNTVLPIMVSFNVSVIQGIRERNAKLRQSLQQWHHYNAAIANQLAQNFAK
jgi:hypothetical protein